MKITLKRILICGISLLAVLLLMIAMVLPIRVLSMPGSLAESELCVGSIWANLSSPVFHPAFLSVRALADGNISNVDGDDNLVKVMAIITLIVFFVNILAIAGAFFLKTNKAARKLIIPVYIISAIFYFVAIVISTAPLSYSNAHGTAVAPDSSMGSVMAMVFASIVVFVIMLIVSGVVKEKKIATIGK